MDMAIFTRALAGEMLLKDYIPGKSELPETFIPVKQFTDCKSLFDALSKDTTAFNTTDKRLSIDLCAIADMCATFGKEVVKTLKWIPTWLMIADHMTKEKPTGELREILSKGRISLVRETNQDYSLHPLKKPG